MRYLRPHYRAKCPSQVRSPYGRDTGRVLTICIHRRISALLETLRSLDIPEIASVPSHPTRSTNPDPWVLVDLRGGIRPLHPDAFPQALQSFVFFGPSSSLVCLRRHLRHEKAGNIPRTLEAATELADCPSNAEPLRDATLPPISMAAGLFRIFSRSANVFFPVLEPTVLDQILSKAYESYGTEPATPMHELFYLVIAIAALIGKRNNAALAAQACSWFSQATSTMNTGCDHSSLLDNIVLLQKTLLICVFLLLSPASGDLWRHLGYAIRHLFDLSHRPLTEEGEYRELLRTLTRTLYYLERYALPLRTRSCFGHLTFFPSHTSIAFGRPSLLTIGDDLRQVRSTVHQNSTELMWF